MIYIRSIETYPKYGNSDITIIDEEHHHDYDVYLNYRFNVRFDVRMSDTRRICIRGLDYTDFKPIFQDGELIFVLKDKDVCHGENSGYCHYSEFKQRWFKRVYKMVRMLPQNITQKIYVINYGI